MAGVAFEAAALLPDDPPSVRFGVDDRSDDCLVRGALPGVALTLAVLATEALAALGLRLALRAAVLLAGEAALDPDLVAVAAPVPVLAVPALAVPVLAVPLLAAEAFLAAPRVFKEALKAVAGWNFTPLAEAIFTGSPV